MKNFKTLLPIFICVYLICVITVYGSNNGGETNNNPNKIPSMARKAGGGRRKVEVITTTTPITVGSQEILNESLADIIVDESSEEGEEEERPCRKSSHFWHIRGRLCVPLICDFGRNNETGRCLPALPFNSFSNNRGAYRGGGGYQWYHKNRKYGRNVGLARG